LEIILAADHPAGKAKVMAGDLTVQLDIAANDLRGHRVQLQLPAGKMRLAVDLVFEGKTQGPHQVILKRL